MKLMVRFRGVDATAAMLDHVKGVLAEAMMDLDARRASVLLSSEGGYCECLVEIGLSRGAVWVVRSGSDDALVALEAAGDRVASLVAADRLRGPVHARLSRDAARRAA